MSNGVRPCAINLAHPPVHAGIFMLSRNIYRTEPDLERPASWGKAAGMQILLAITCDLHGEFILILRPFFFALLPSNGPHVLSRRSDAISLPLHVLVLQLQPCHPLPTRQSIR
jgi:hypothetical protein